jgi:SWI/SNF-related matrix-associated actin-dependent regulator of chromatin subfamily A3
MSALFFKLVPCTPPLEVQAFALQHSPDRIALQMRDGTTFGYLRRHLVKAFEQLQEHIGFIELEAVGITKDILENLRRAMKPSDATCHVDINIYGPRENAKLVGDMLTEHKLWLQRPDNFSDKEFLYMNPHTISFAELEGHLVVEEPVQENDAAAPSSQSDEAILDQVMSEVHEHLNRDKRLSMESADQVLLTGLLP